MFRKYSSKFFGTLFFASVENFTFRKCSFKNFGTLFLQVSKITCSENIVRTFLEIYFSQVEKNINPNSFFLELFFASSKFKIIHRKNIVPKFLELYFASVENTRS